MVYYVLEKNEHQTVSGIQFEFIDVMAVIFNLTTLQSVAAPGNDFILDRIYIWFLSSF